MKETVCRGSAALALTTLLLLGACGEAARSARPEARPDRPPRPEAVAAPAAAAAPSPQGAAIRESYLRAETDLRDRGLLRTDAGRAEQAGIDAGTLAATFVQVAMYDEFDPGSGRRPDAAQASLLRRWQVPVQIAVEFGASVPEPDRQQDLTVIGSLAVRLGAATGHPVGLVESGGNLTVLVVDEAERRTLGPWLRQNVPGIPSSLVLSITGVAISELCLSVGFSGAQDAFAFERAIVVVRAEQPPLSRLSCYHEEIAQSLGLVNDTPAARPSIFNDDEEFALLTGYDELMLAILYDPRLRPGMDVEQVAPLAAAIAGELLPGAAAETLAEATES